MEFGSVAEWVGAVGTVGALLLGLGLLAKERAINRRRSVDDLLTWLSWAEVPDREHGVRIETTVHVVNTGRRPMRTPLLMFPDRRGGYATQMVSSTGRTMMLPPNAETQAVIHGQPRNTVAQYVLMNGEDGRIWIRKVDEHRYPNVFGQTLLLMLFVLLERADGASPRRQRRRTNQVHGKTGGTKLTPSPSAEA